MPVRKDQPEAQSAPPPPWRRVWKYREAVLWLAVLALLATVQRPFLEGWYYRATAAEAPASAVTWRTGLDGALAEARASHKRVLVDFSASWCPPCIAMKHEVWPDPEVARVVGAGFIPLMVDADDDKGLSARYQVEGIPAVLVLDGEGQVLKRHDGFLPRAGMLTFLASAPKAAGK